MKQIASWMHEALEGREKPEVLARIRAEVVEINKRFPLP